MGEMTLDFLGRQIVDLRGDMHGLHVEMTALKAEMDVLHLYVRTHLIGVQTAVEEYVDKRFAALDASLDARFAQVHETMATNLATVLAAIGRQEERP
jgi:hypothetical protein